MSKDKTINEIDVLYSAPFGEHIDFGQVDVGHNFSFIRVPGGWIFINRYFSDPSGVISCTSVFVPYDVEFKP